MTQTHDHQHHEGAAPTTPATPVAATKPAKAEKVAKIEQNGVSRPGTGTATARIWEIADAESAKTSAPAKRAEVLKTAEAEGINVTTAATQFGRWCKFQGIKAVPEEKKAKATAAPAAEAIPAE